VFPDAVPALRRARAAGLAVAVLTDGDEDQQRSKLDRLDLSPDVDLLLASSVLPAGKPDARAFLAAAALGGAQTSEVLMVGDSLADDVRGAQDVGIDAVLVDRQDRHPESARPSGTDPGRADAHALSRFSRGRRPRLRP
jgi:putative hydrolase of the HAD superfamily